jgi:hypothetical protein
MALLLLVRTPAHAVRYEDIPYELRRRLPEFVLRIANPQALAALSLDDLGEFADAYEEGRLHFVNEVRVEGSGGPLTPEYAKLVLQIPEGAPYIEQRFLRIAKAAYGNGIFSSLEWEVHENADTSVDILLWYSSNNPVQIAPDVGISGVAGILYGVQYLDLYHDGQDKQITAGVQLSENFADEPRIYGSYADNTLNRGRNGYSVSASVGNDWRTRIKGVSRAQLRARVSRADATYSWIDRKPSGTQRLSVGTGMYHQDVAVLAGDPTGGGQVEFDQEGTGEYVSVQLSQGKQDQLFTPKKGHSLRIRAEKHVGDFDFQQFSVDAREYIPVANILGKKPDTAERYGGRNNIKRFFPTASIGVQVQASVADGHVPYTEEIYLGSTTALRGYRGSRAVGTKMIGARAEYRFTLDDDRKNEAFIFTDHALIGDDLDDMESLSTVGAGALVKLPIYGGIKLGGYYGRAIDGSDSSYGIALGYQF